MFYTLPTNWRETFEQLLDELIVRWRTAINYLITSNLTSDGEIATKQAPFLKFGFLCTCFSFGNKKKGKPGAMTQKNLKNWP